MTKDTSDKLAHACAAMNAEGTIKYAIVWIEPEDGAVVTNLTHGSMIKLLDSVAGGRTGLRSLGELFGEMS